MIYFDTSALFKLYVDEPGYEIVRAAAQADPIRCTHLVAYTEFCAAIAKAIRTRRLTQAAAAALVAQFERDWAAYSVVSVDEALARRAAQLAMTFELRGYDSLHLAAAERLKQAVPLETLRFAVFDEKLCAAAVKLGFEILA
ncbi:MAG: type II toxin-antitoxin system VapC family toxin [Nevskia sp.]|jgi:predicted nucleic acid-binding protein|nr:type II toxin-antitoxin system VapC family toxin [Nevskia sp.]